MPKEHDVRRRLARADTSRAEARGEPALPCFNSFRFIDQCLARNHCIRAHCSPARSNEAPPLAESCAAHDIDGMTGEHATLPGAGAAAGVGRLDEHANRGRVGPLHRHP